MKQHSTETVQDTSDSRQKSRAAASLGRAIDWARGVSPKQLDRYERERAERKALAISSAQEKSEGLNKTALELIRARGVDHHDWTDKGGSEPTSRQWTLVASTNQRENTTIGDKIEKLPVLLIQGETIPVDALVLNVTSDSKGVYTYININGLNEHTGKELPLDKPKSEPPKFGNELSIDIHPDGSISFGRKNDKAPSYVPITPTETNVESFLQGVGAVMSPDGAQPMSNNMPSLEV